MRAVIQRCIRAQVDVDGETVGKIGKGLTAFFGMSQEDDGRTIDYMLDKLINLRIFEDDDEKMNLSIADIAGELLIIPNFTLYGDARKGRRPGFSAAAPPQKAEEIFSELVNKAGLLPVHAEFGIFQADMKVEVLNDGPVTILLDSERLF